MAMVPRHRLAVAAVDHRAAGWAAIEVLAFPTSRGRGWSLLLRSPARLLASYLFCPHLIRTQRPAQADASLFSAGAIRLDEEPISKKAEAEVLSLRQRKPYLPVGSNTNLQSKKSRSAIGYGVSDT
jgi:hypothetical protein